MSQGLKNRVGESQEVLQNDRNLNSSHESPSSGTRHADSLVDEVVAAVDLSKNSASEVNTNAQNLSPVSNSSLPVNQMVELELWVPIDRVGLIIGLKGNVVKNMQESTRTVITVHNEEIDHEKGAKLVTISGQEGSTRRAQQMIQDVVQRPLHLSNMRPGRNAAPQKNQGTGKSVATGGLPSRAGGDSVNRRASVDADTADAEAENSKVISVPNSCVGIIIGKGGETIHDLQNRSGAHIKVTPDRNATKNASDRTIWLTGSASSILAAEKLVMNIVNDNAHRTKPFGTDSQSTLRADQTKKPAKREKASMSDHRVHPQESVDGRSPFVAHQSQSIESPEEPRDYAGEGTVEEQSSIEATDACEALECADTAAQENTEAEEKDENEVEQISVEEGNESNLQESVGESESTDAVDQRTESERAHEQHFSHVRAQYPNPYVNALPAAWMTPAGYMYPNAEETEYYRRLYRDQAYGPGMMNAALVHGTPSVSMTVFIPNDKVGLVIGRAGNSIRELQERSGAHIVVAKESEASMGNHVRPVTLTGPFMQVEAAREMIMEKISGYHLVGRSRTSSVHSNSPQIHGEPLAQQQHPTYPYAHSPYYASVYPGVAPSHAYLNPEQFQSAARFGAADSQETQQDSEYTGQQRGSKDSEDNSYSDDQYTGAERDDYAVENTEEEEYGSSSSGVQYAMNPAQFAMQQYHHQMMMAAAAMAAAQQQYPRDALYPEVPYDINQAMHYMQLQYQHQQYYAPYYQSSIPPPQSKEETAEIPEIHLDANHANNTQEHSETKSETTQMQESSTEHIKL